MFQGDSHWSLFSCMGLPKVSKDHYGSPISRFTGLPLSSKEQHRSPIGHYLVVQDYQRALRITTGLPQDNIQVYNTTISAYWEYHCPQSISTGFPRSQFSCTELPFQLIGTTTVFKVSVQDSRRSLFSCTGLPQVIIQLSGTTFSAYWEYHCP